MIPRYKMLGQIIVAVGVGIAVLQLSQQNPPLYNTRLIFPFFKTLIPDLGWFYVVFAVLVLVFASNGVNMTDGLDGLAISTFAVARRGVHRAGLRHRARRAREVPAVDPLPDAAS